MIEFKRIAILDEHAVLSGRLRQCFDLAVIQICGKQRMIHKTGDMRAPRLLHKILKNEDIFPKRDFFSDRSFFFFHTPSLPECFPPSVTHGFRYNRQPVFSAEPIIALCFRNAFDLIVRQSGFFRQIFRLLRLFIPDHHTIVFRCDPD